MSSAVDIHPRMMDRLERTLARRLRNFEIARDNARRLIEVVIDRIVGIEKDFDLPLAECRHECMQALADLEALSAYAKNSEEEIEPVLRRFARVAAFLERLDVPRLMAVARAVYPGTAPALPPCGAVYMPNACRKNATMRARPATGACFDWAQPEMAGLSAPATRPVSQIDCRLP